MFSARSQVIRCDPTPTNAYVSQDGNFAYASEDGNDYYVQDNGAPPAQAAAWGYTSLLFSDGPFDGSTIDLTNTKAAGFKWYVNNAFPNVIAGGVGWNTAPPAQSGDFSFSQGAMTIATDRGGDNQAINTVVWNGSAVIGTTFPAQCYVEVVMGFNPALATSGNTGWPIFWMMPVGMLSGAIGDGVNYVELDGFEAFPTGSGVISPICETHEWNFTSQSVYTDNASATGHPTQAQIGTALHRYGILLVSAAQNSGTGIRGSYFDNTHMTPDVNYTATGPASPVAIPSNPNGTFFSLDNGSRYALMIGTGVSWPLTVAQIRVWGL